MSATGLAFVWLPVLRRAEGDGRGGASSPPPCPGREREPSEARRGDGRLEHAVEVRALSGFFYARPRSGDPTSGRAS
jgi:hypothetical protein